jgi:cysteine desulfurase
MPIYLDNSATTRVCDEAALKVMDVMQNHYGNPSSLHSMGVDAELILNGARESIANALFCKPSEIFFTSGGTEANNLAVFGAAKALQRRGKRVVTTSIEHPSVQNVMRELEKQGFDVVYLSPAADGAIKEEELFNAVTPDTILVSMMLVNNETGAIQPVAAAKKAVKKAGCPALVHCDAVQGFLKIPFRPKKLGIDLVTTSSHKIHGPKGAGALFIDSGARIVPVLYGGGQEKGIRSGTEPLPAIAGFGEAARVAFLKLDETTNLTRSLRDYCIKQLSQMPEVVLNPANCTDAARELYAPHILNFSVPGIRSETMLHYLESKDIFVSSGSACSKGAKSQVLSAMGLSAAIIDSAIRVSFCRDNTLPDAKALVEEITRGADRLIRSKVNA